MTRRLKTCTLRPMKPGILEIPASILGSVETLDELQDWLTAQHPDIMAELHEARREFRGFRVS